MTPKPSMYDGVYTRGPDGGLVRIVEPRWYQLKRHVELVFTETVPVTIVQCGHVTVCRAQPVKFYE